MITKSYTTNFNVIVLTIEMTCVVVVVAVSFLIISAVRMGTGVFVSTEGHVDEVIVSFGTSVVTVRVEVEGVDVYATVRPDDLGSDVVCETVWGFASGTR